MGSSICPSPSAADATRVAAATRLADELLGAAERLASRTERRASARLGRLLEDPAGRELVFLLTDEVLRSEDPTRSMGRLRSLLSGSLPPSLGPVDRVGLRLAGAASRVAPRPVAAAVRHRLRRETRRVILSSTDPGFARHVARSRSDGERVNVNLLGEAILGDDEAEARVVAVQERLRRPDVEYVSVKISALCANLDVLSFDRSVDRICERLRRVYGTALETTPPGFVNLDMEEYRDLHLTVAAFRRVLDEPPFLDLPAGIALQAYLPDSAGVLDEIREWATHRVAAGGAPVKVRLVKGANLAMELVEAELAGWDAAPFATKAEVDANYKAMLDTALEGASDGALRVGVASHNLLDVAWGLVRRAERDVTDRVDVEMLEGMAPPQSRAVRDEAGGLVVYTPVVSPHEMSAAIAYLSRRLDENAAEDNFLRALFSLTRGSPRWALEQQRFEVAVAARHHLDTSPRRRQDRTEDVSVSQADATFANEPDTDFTVAANRSWIATHLAADRLSTRPGLLTTAHEIDEVVERARGAAAEWAATSTATRRGLLGRVADELARRRGRMVAVMAHEAAKAVREGDTEMSETIDFARWAASGTHTIDRLTADGLTVRPYGVVVVAGPWNFPCAIPANGVLSALAAGNAVLLKPAPEAVETAVELVDALHQAGVPPAVVQLVTCPDDEVGRHLVTHDDVDTVVLTGSLDTAEMFLGWKPSMRLLAETSGKNAIVVTGAADMDLAIRDVVRSAFGHAGQKCSAASLVILTAEVATDPAWLTRLADAVRSLRIGPATDVDSMMTPLITPPADRLTRALTVLDPSEAWLVEPRSLDEAGSLDEQGRRWSPGVRTGVAGGSWFHRTECFGPVLGVMAAEDLDEAIDLQNGTPYGLTGGLHSLDPVEIDHWLARVEVGNAYVNRHITGAIVRRQPFGGWKRSSIGPGAKPGGPDDVLRFVRIDAGAVLPSRDEAQHSSRSWWERRFGDERDASGLRAERNTLRYRPIDGVIVRAGDDTSVDELDLLRDVARLVGVPVEISVPPSWRSRGSTPGVIAEREDELATRMSTGHTRTGTAIERLRAVEAIGDELAAACHRSGVVVDTAAVTGHGRVELPHWFREQAISRTLHRHGRIAS